MWLVQGKRMTPLLQQPPGEQPWHSSQMAALPEVYVQNASLEIAWSKVALDGRTIAGVNIMPFFTDEAEGFDINNQYDWDYAEAAVAQRKFALPEVAEPPFVDTKISEGSVG